MPDDPLRPADPEDLRQALAFALSFDGRKRWRQADEQMARITADHLVRYVEMAGFVLMRRPGRGDFARVARGTIRIGQYLAARCHQRDTAAAHIAS